jgi:hypothetical protein
MKTKLRFSDIKGMLSRDEMKKVVGGYGTCGVRIGSQSWCGMSSWQTQSVAAQNGAYWCCDSCASNGGSASYC